MKIKDILSCTPKVLSQDQREYYFENGCLLLENFITGARLEILQDITQDFIEKSRACNASLSSLRTAHQRIITSLAAAQ